MHRLESNAVINSNQSLNAIWFNQIPEAGRFLTATSVGNIIFYAIDQMIYKLILIRYSKDFPKFIQRNKESTSFFVSYFLQIIFQHYLNALFVYGLDTVDSKQKYLTSLLLTYSTYSTSLIGTTIVNTLLLKQGVSKSIAMWGTVFGFGIVNYFLLRHLMKKVPKTPTVASGKKKQQIDVRSVRKSTLKRIDRGGGGGRNQVVESFLQSFVVIFKLFESLKESLKPTIVRPNAF